MTPSLEALAELAQAAPEGPEGAHLSDEQLGALRGGQDDDSALDAGFRHLASCAACRARLSEPSAQVTALVDRSAKPEAPAGAKKTSVLRRPWLAGFAVAAGVLLVFLMAGRGEKAPLATLSQRPYVGVMGSNSEPGVGVAPEDRNIELRLQGSGIDAARVLTVDSNGAVIAPWIAFRPEPAGLRALLAPRAFRPHAGELFAIVVYGEAAAVASAAASSDLHASSLSDLRAQIEGRAGAARVLVEPLRVREP